MIVIARNRVKFLIAGRALTIPDTSGRYRKGRTYALSTGGPRICTVEILDVQAGAIRVRLAAGADAVRFLARHPSAAGADYVADLSRAMPGEPEALSVDDLERIERAAAIRQRQELARRRAQAETLPLAGRLQRLEVAHHRGEASLERDLRIIGRRLQQVAL